MIYSDFQPASATLKLNNFNHDYISFNKSLSTEGCIKLYYENGGVTTLYLEVIKLISDISPLDLKAFNGQKTKDDEFVLNLIDKNNTLYNFIGESNTYGETKSVFTTAFPNPNPPPGSVGGGSGGGDPDPPNPEDPIVACGAGETYTGNQGTFNYNILLGSATGGTSTLSYNSYSIPDRFVVTHGGVVVIDTGFVGSWTPTRIAQLDTIYGAGNWVQGGIGQGTASFVKTSADTYATVTVYGPLPGTAFEFTLGCPA